MTKKYPPEAKKLCAVPQLPAAVGAGYRLDDKITG
jgi:hypothetical protein